LIRTFNKETEMPDIVTDQSVLAKKSEPVNDLEIGDIIQQLSVSIPEHAYGLAAPQIDIHKRVFLANLASGSYAFVNPEIVWSSPDKVPSEESCLSLPGIHRCVERHSKIKVSCYKLIDMKTGDLTVDPEPMQLSGLESCIVQHEYDHLNGVLITNHPMTMTREEKLRSVELKRMERIDKARNNKAEKFMKTLDTAKIAKTDKLSTKNKAKKKRASTKEKRHQRTLNRQEKIRVETQERYKVEKDGLFSEDKSPTPDTVNEPKQD
jgi:peptide deformylase